MCVECPPPVLDLARRIGEYLDQDWSGGALHIVLADGNIETHHIEWCLKQPEVPELLAGFGRELLAMSAPERHIVVEMANEPEHLRPWVYGPEEA